MQNFNIAVPSSFTELFKSFHKKLQVSNVNLEAISYDEFFALFMKSTTEMLTFTSITDSIQAEKAKQVNQTSVTVSEATTTPQKVKQAAVTSPVKPATKPATKAATPEEANATSKPTIDANPSIEVSKPKNDITKPATVQQAASDTTDLQGAQKSVPSDTPMKRVVKASQPAVTAVPSPTAAPATNLAVSSSVTSNNEAVKQVKRVQKATPSISQAESSTNNTSLPVSTTKEQAKEQPKEQAKVVQPNEQPKVVQPKEQPKEQVKVVQPKEQPKEQVKVVQPNEQPKVVQTKIVQPKEQQKDQPKGQDKEQPKEQAKVIQSKEQAKEQPKEQLKVVQPKEQANAASTGQQATSSNSLSNLVKSVKKVTASSSTPAAPVVAAPVVTPIVTKCKSDDLEKAEVEPASKMQDEDAKLVSDKVVTTVPAKAQEPVKLSKPVKRTIATTSVVEPVAPAAPATTVNNSSATAVQSDQVQETNSDEDMSDSQSQTSNANVSKVCAVCSKKIRLDKKLSLESQLIDGKFYCSQHKRSKKLKTSNTASNAAATSTPSQSVSATSTKNLPSSATQSGSTIKYTADGDVDFAETPAVSWFSGSAKSKEFWRLEKFDDSAIETPEDVNLQIHKLTGLVVAFKAYSVMPKAYGLIRKGQFVRIDDIDQDDPVRFWITYSDMNLYSFNKTDEGRKRKLEEEQDELYDEEYY